MPVTIDCFKAYDIRGQIPNQLNPEVARGIRDAGAEVMDIQLSGTEMVWQA